MLFQRISQLRLISVLLPKYVVNTLLIAAGLPGLAWAETDNDLDETARASSEQRIVNVVKENKNDANNENSNSGNTSVKMIVGGQSKDGVAKELQLPVQD